MKVMGDDGLLASIAAGDRDAFASLYRLYRADVYRFAAHMCGSQAAAEDVVQDVFLAVIQQADRYRPGQSGVKAWLLGIARNHVRRWRYRRPFLPLPHDESEDGRRLAAEHDPVADLTRQRDSAALSRALIRLPARYREAIVLCDLQELDYETVAGVLGCPIGTVRSRLSRGRALLARQLTADGDAICPSPAPKHL